MLTAEVHASQPIPEGLGESLLLRTKEPGSEEPETAANRARYGQSHNNSRRSSSVISDQKKNQSCDENDNQRREKHRRQGLS